MKLIKIDYSTIMLLLCCLLCSCMDNTLLSTGTDDHCPRTDKDMYLRVSVPRTYGNYDNGDPEMLIETLDVLVFAKGKTDDNYYVQTACQGKLTTTRDQFEVIMPIGENLIVHVFANCHEDMVAKDFYNSAGTRMDAMLAKLALNTKVINGATMTSLPMHGYTTGVTITKDRTAPLEVPVLRSVAAAQVVTKATLNAADPNNPVAGSADITDADGTILFDMRELYAYFAPTGGLSPAKPEAYKPLAPGETDKTRDVVKASLPAENAFAVTDVDHPVSIKKPDRVRQIGCLYLYENKPWSENGFDQPDIHKAYATTRLVVGGVYKGATGTDGHPLITYYRIDFAQNGVLTEILRNHKYTFSIEKVSGPGYDTPEEAATGVPINIYVKLIDWTSVWNNVDFDTENYLSTETKDIVLPRDVNSRRTISMESDVELGEQWTLSFDKTSTVNGNATVAEVKGTNGVNTLSIRNTRYWADITALSQVKPGVNPFTLQVTALKAYSDNAGILTGPPTEAYGDVLYIKIRNLTVGINLSQADRSPDDWGNGGDQETEVGKLNGIRVPYGDINLGGSACTDAYKTQLSKLIWAEGNLRQQNNDGSGATIMAGPTDYGHYYTFMSEYTGNTTSNGKDPCKSLDAATYGTGWRTPTRLELVALSQCTNKPPILDKLNDVNGMWFMNSTTGLFLPVAGSRNSHVGSGTTPIISAGECGRYWSNYTNGKNLWYGLYCTNGYANTDTPYARENGFSVRCVKGK